MTENIKKINKAIISKKDCIACGSCTKVCPKNAIVIENGSYAIVDHELCIGCRSCLKTCPALAITMENEIKVKENNTKKWNDYLWIISIIYLLLGLFNILFAWLGLLCFFIPLIISIFTGSKLYCNSYCGRGQLLNLLGNKLNISLKNNSPKFLRSKWFRYIFLIFFLAMFINMIFTTYLVFSGTKSLSEVVTLFWTFKLPWDFAYYNIGYDWISQFAFGFYSIMLTSTLIGLIVMVLFRPRTWCVFCPMGTMTHLICRFKNRKENITD
jgi:Pyruvate/2-oxoacid:ferredoxin oxidoreductase delta subunit